MKINAYCSCSIDEAAASNVGVGIVLEAKEKSQLIQKKAGYYLGIANKYFAYATAIKFALSSIQSKYKNNHIVLNVDDEEIANLLTLEDITDHAQHLSTILGMRRFASSYQDLNIVLDAGVSTQIIDANIIAEKAKISQKNHEMSAERHEVS